MTDSLKFKNTDLHWTCFTKAGWAWRATIYTEIYMKNPTNFHANYISEWQWMVLSGHLVSQRECTTKPFHFDARHWLTEDLSPNRTCQGDSHWQTLAISSSRQAFWDNEPRLAKIVYGRVLIYLEGVEALHEFSPRGGGALAQFLYAGVPTWSLKLYPFCCNFWKKDTLSVAIFRYKTCCFQPKFCATKGRVLENVCHWG